MRIITLCLCMGMVTIASAQKNLPKPDADWQKYLKDNRKGASKAAVTLNISDPLYFGTIAIGAQYLPMKYFGIEGSYGIGILKSGMANFTIKEDEFVPRRAGDNLAPRIDGFRPISMNYLIFHFPLSHNMVNCFTSLGLFLRNRTSEVMVDEYYASYGMAKAKGRNVGLSVNSQFSIARNWLLGYSFGVGMEKYQFENMPYGYLNWATNTWTVVPTQVESKSLEYLFHIRLGYSL